MKKLILTCEVLIIFLFLAKIAVVGGIMTDSEPADFLLNVEQAAADSLVPPAPAVSPPKDVFEDGLSEERTLLSSLLARQKELDEREESLRSEEKRLQELKDEILAKMDRLQEVERQVTAVLEAAEQMKAEKYRSMAKVYESAPPAQAGAMLEKLDSRTAATIIMNMKSKNAGVVLGYIKPDKSVAITREITREAARSRGEQ
ncbi:MAG: hypothetical protein JXI32_03320 [Deltaproteobacteria bacterium]|nr:hypothetical protein [Deltaproteobacteria bacterium]